MLKESRHRLSIHVSKTLNARFEEMKLLLNIGFLYLLLMYLDVAFRHLITEQKMTIEVHVRVPVLWERHISFQNLFDMVYSSPKVELSPTKLSKSTVFPVHLFVQMQPFKKRSFSTPNSNSTSLQTPKHHECFDLLACCGGSRLASTGSCTQGIAVRTTGEAEKTDQKMVEIGCRWDYCLSNHA